MSQGRKPVIVSTSQMTSNALPDAKPANSSEAGGGFQSHDAPQSEMTAGSVPFRSQYPSMSAPRNPQIPSAMPGQMYPYYMIPGALGSGPLNMGHMSQSLPKPNPVSAPLHQQGPNSYYTAQPNRPAYNIGANSVGQIPHQSGAALPGSGGHGGHNGHGGFQPAYSPFQSVQHQTPIFAQGQLSGASSQPSYVLAGHMATPHSHHFSEAGYPGANNLNNQSAIQGYFPPDINTSNLVSSYSSELNTSPAIPRGPPRKPRQSGHALWVGNLPPGAQVMDLKDHFSREATDDIESVKLISKSNCAFVNYRTQAACAAAMNRFHDSRFHGTRLVCRLRKSSVPASTSLPSLAGTETAVTDSSAETTAGSTVPDQPSPERESPSVERLPIDPIQRIATRFFILKSLTLQDLETSTRNGIWATQAHNEEALNNAYKQADTVYLIFSANKSGEYFGYARMSSAIPAPDADLSSISMPTTQQAVSPVATYGNFVDYGPRSIPTPATEWAPKGRIIDDSARGTIFWEADFEPIISGQSPSEAHYTTVAAPNDQLGTVSPSHDEAATLPAPSSSSAAVASDEGSEYPLIARSPTDSKKPASCNATAAPSATATVQSTPGAPDDRDEAQSRGNPFRIEWVSTRKVPFYRTRGLRNPWNQNREIKIARDGTEIEPAVGRKLILLFGGGVP